MTIISSLGDVFHNCQGKVTRRNPSSRIKALAAMQHNAWIKEGKQPMDMRLLKAIV
ncbi:MAG: hypothetical protein QNJ47_23350 [Nostocaceae cyanobacterium]|nr:hypothetical protein [Nostocaceae cyanobacterium]